ncbi:uncharacterized protein LOC134216403 [Armigeres subalbatus]|uniref:uncharacterized protein LOC134216403 n=1 Tax=Armigeres subalbatus TaxID=124917 RepID=UPI002ED084F9
MLQLNVIEFKISTWTPMDALDHRKKNSRLVYFFSTYLNLGCNKFMAKWPAYLGTCDGKHYVRARMTACLVQLSINLDRGKERIFRIEWWSLVFVVNAAEPPRRCTTVPLESLAVPTSILPHHHLFTGVFDSKVSTNC